MQLVEVISGAETSAQVLDTMKELTLRIGKKLVVAKDSPGFIVNRVARHDDCREPAHIGGESGN
jgi:3-hydroxybutyryl-CoA dehydrogenase